jgi:2-polyprenyl-3-methyl-5-hydroxy-6-metoxy-1,4-benzoquinol methylase
MSRADRTLQPGHFNAIYASDPDPWKFSSSPYEKNKYAATLAALPKARYASALEIGCSIGVLSRELAARCDAVLAVDAAPAPLAEARRRCADRPNVRFDQIFAPEQWPDAVFDLILISEVVYYMDEQDVGRLASKVARALAPTGDVMLVHWTGVTDYPLSGDHAAELFINLMAPAASIVRGDRYDLFRLDVLTSR